MQRARPLGQHPHLSLLFNMSVKKSDGDNQVPDGCVHPFQCPNPLCQRVFTTRRGLSMHFYHQQNVFCNPPNQFRTLGEMASPSMLPDRMDPLESTDEDNEPIFEDEFSVPPWSGSEDLSSSQSLQSNGPPPLVLINPHDNPEMLPTVDSMQTTFGISYTTAHSIETKLAKMLNDIQAPKTMYASILKWGRQAYVEGYNFVPRHGNKDSLIASLQTQLHLGHFRPDKIEIELPGDKLRVEITRFNFTKGLHSLLRHPDLTSNMDNLDVNPTDPFGKYIAPNGRIGAVHSAQWYQNAYHTCIKDPKTDFLVPICFACDEAKLGGGTTGCWPLMFSTTIFNQKLRNKSIAWRPLGYIYDLSIDESSSLHSSQTTHLRYQRLHAIFKAILESLLEAQEPNALDGISLTLGGVTKVVNIMVPVNFIIGDMQGGDKICACSPCYSNKMQRLCRKCNVKGSDADDPYVKCRRMIMSRIQSLVVNNEFDKLDQINQYHVHNAWFDVSYGGCKYGIFSAACPVEALHAMENGLVKQCLQVLFTDSLNKSARGRLDLLAQELYSWDRQHYLTAGTAMDMPRLLFKDGVTTITNITASTNVGIMFTIIVLSLTSKGSQFFDTVLGEEKANKMRYVFQQLLCYWVWLKKEYYWKVGDTNGKEAARLAIQKMLVQLVQLWPRERGQGWQTAKHHEQMHVPDDIEAYGAHRNYHTGPSEHNHIDNIKKMAKMTQGRKSVLDWQIANRRADSYILDLAYNLMHPASPPDTLPDADTSFQGISHLGAKGQFVFTRVPNSIQVIFAWTSATDVGPLPDYIIEYIVQYFPRYCMVDLDRFVLPFYTEYQRHGHTFRAHPNYRAGQQSPWYDWAMFRWRKEQRSCRRNRSSYAVDVAYMDNEVNEDQYDYAPAKILGFVKVGSALSCIVRPCNITYTKSSVFSTQWSLAFWDRAGKNAMINLVSVDAIVRHCLMIPVDGVDSILYHEVYERERWANEFHEDM